VCDVGEQEKRVLACFSDDAHALRVVRRRLGKGSTLPSLPGDAPWPSRILDDISAMLFSPVMNAQTAPALNSPIRSSQY